MREGVGKGKGRGLRERGGKERKEEKRGKKKRGEESIGEKMGLGLALPSKKPANNTQHLGVNFNKSASAEAGSCQAGGIVEGLCHQ